MLFDEIKNLPEVKKGEIKYALDLGCIGGNDTAVITRILLSKGYTVFAISEGNRDDERRLIKFLEDNNVNHDKLKYVAYDFNCFENKQINYSNFPIKIKSLDVLVSRNTLSFCNPDKIKVFLERLCDCLKEEGRFIANVFGKNHVFRNSKTDKVMFFADEKNIKTIFPKKIFKNFDPHYFNKEVHKYDGEIVP